MDNVMTYPIRYTKKVIDRLAKVQRALDNIVPPSNHKEATLLALYLYEQAEIHCDELNKILIGRRQHDLSTQERASYKKSYYSWCANLDKSVDDVSKMSSMCEEKEFVEALIYANQWDIYLNYLVADMDN